MATKKSTRTKTEKTAAKPAAEPESETTPARRGKRRSTVVNEANPERTPRRYRGVPVLAGVKVYSPERHEWEVELDMDNHEYREYNSYGAFVHLKFAWNMEDENGHRCERTATIEIEDAKLFELLKDHDAEVIETRRVLASQLPYTPVLDGVLPEDIDHCIGEEGLAKKRAEPVEAEVDHAS